MWQCPKCDGQLEDQFDSCWKCGTMSDGRRDPDFAVTEPVRPEDQAAVIGAHASERPELELPTMTYFAIPLFLVVMVAETIWQVTASRGQLIGISSDQLIGNSPVSPFEIVSGTVLVIAFVSLIWFPVLINVLRGFVHLLRLGRRWGSISDFLWLLSMFLLPDSFRRQHPWFVPLYVASLCGIFIAPPILAASNAIFMATR